MISAYGFSVVSLMAVGLLVAMPAGAENHALVMSVGNYADPKASLPGIDLDVNNAKVIARSMGVPDKNMTFLKDEQMTEAKLSAAFDALGMRANRGDNLFIYYTGHGAQLGAGGGKCSEGMVTYDMQMFADNRIEEALSRLAAKAGQLVFMNDSCFSGGQADGVLTRALGASEQIKPKAFKLYTKVADTPGYTCGEAINAKMTREMVPAAKRNGSNMLYIAASQDNEVALATEKGSAATRAWLNCLKPEHDLNQSGSLSGEEIRSCAQRYLDSRRFNQHITLVGNKDLPLSFVGSGSIVPVTIPAPTPAVVVVPTAAPAAPAKPPAAPAPVATSPAPTSAVVVVPTAAPAAPAKPPAVPAPVATSPVPTPAVVAASTATPAAPAKPPVAPAPVATSPAPTSVAEAAPAPTPPVVLSPVPSSTAAPAELPVIPAAALEDIRVASSPEIVVSLSLAKQRLKIEQDVLDFSVTTSKAGYLTILQVGSDGKTFNRLFPNDLDKSDYVNAGTVRMPRPSWVLRAGGPVGKSYLLAVVSDTPREFAKGMKAEGPFRSGTSSRTLYVAATGGDVVNPGRYGASEVISLDEY